MFFSFVDELRAAGIPASMKEHLTLLEALDASVIGARPEEFYYLARATFVKDEGLLDRFDQVFGKVFKGIETSYGAEAAPIPEEWLKKVAELYSRPEQMEEIKSLGSWEEIMETLKKRLEEQKGAPPGRQQVDRHRAAPPLTAMAATIRKESGSAAKGGTAVRSRCGTSASSRTSTTAASSAPGTSRSRCGDCAASPGRAPPTNSTSTDDRRHRAQGLARHSHAPRAAQRGEASALPRRGGSMDPHIKVCEELFSAATGEFKNLEFFYFHNCVYEGVWKDNRRRFTERTPTWDVLHKYGHDYKLVLVGDASMSPYEVSHPGGSVEHFNDEAGAVWLQRMVNTYPSAVWLNPTPERYWSYNQSTEMIRALMQDRMYPLTLEGLDGAMRNLSRKA
jgi:uncharacterized protein with von Willebrand factor type A (vWA) domain